ncbi:MAG: ribonuclease HI [Clostridia bacterium]|nr:ribonuclease HI [Clostridia bacterium]
MKKVTLYTDGACSVNPGVGGWGAVLIFKGVEKQISGAEESTTNNRMELTAVIEGLKCLKEPCVVDVYSDSAYVVNAFLNGWIYGWEQNGFIKSDNKPVLNVDLWQELLRLTRIHNVEFIKVKGHADNAYNNLCDKLATDAVKNFKSGL